MKITITPETNEEREAFGIIEHTSVKEYFLFGNETDAEGSIVDFHDWKGSYRYLMGSLYFFLQSMESELSEGASSPPESQTIKITPEMLGIPSEDTLDKIEAKLQTKLSTDIPGVSAASTPHLKLAHSTNSTKDIEENE